MASQFLLLSLSGPVSGKTRQELLRLGRGHGYRVEVNAEDARIEKADEFSSEDKGGQRWYTVTNSLNDSDMTYYLSSGYDVCSFATRNQYGFWFTVPKSDELSDTLNPYADGVGDDNYGVRVVDDRILAVCVLCRIKERYLSTYGDEILDRLAVAAKVVRKKVMAGDTSVLDYLVRFYGIDDDDDQDVEMDEQSQKVCRLFARA